MLIHFIRSLFDVVTFLSDTIVGESLKSTRHTGGGGTTCRLLQRSSTVAHNSKKNIGMFQSVYMLYVKHSSMPKHVYWYTAALSLPCFHKFDASVFMTPWNPNQKRTLYFVCYSGDYMLTANDMHACKQFLKHTQTMSMQMCSKKVSLKVYSST
jgi:hypothetical protein